MKKKSIKSKNGKSTLPFQLAEVDAINTAGAYELFRAYYTRFRWGANLLAVRSDAYEITTALADKLGRLCRLVKHAKRGDPIPHTRETMEECVAGLVVYLEMLTQLYKLDMLAGFKRELMKAVVQHAHPGKTMSNRT